MRKQLRVTGVCPKKGSTVPSSMRGVAEHTYAHFSAELVIAWYEANSSVKAQNDMTRQLSQVQGIWVERGTKSGQICALFAAVSKSGRSLCSPSPQNAGPPQPTESRDI